MGWYKSGTVNVTNGSRVVTGQGCDFVQFVDVGEAIVLPDGDFYEISKVESAVELRIARDYTGPTAAAQPYSISPIQGYQRELADKAAALIDLHSGVPPQVADASSAAVQAAATAVAAKNVAVDAKDTTVALAPFYGPNPPPDPVPNARWIYSLTGDEFKWIVDEDSGQWVETGATVSVGYATALAAQQAAASAAMSAAQAAASAESAGLSGATIDAGYNLVVTLGNGSSFVVGYVRGEQGAKGDKGDQGDQGPKGDTGDRGESFSVDHVGANLAARDAFDDEPDGFAFVDAAGGNLYLRMGATPGVWSIPIPFAGKGDKGDPGVTTYEALTDKPTLGTAAALDVAETGNASPEQVVKGDDSRLSDPRTPVTHTHASSQIEDASEFGRAILAAENAGAARTALGLNNVTNTADADKPLSNAAVTALAAKQNKLVSGENIKTINGVSLLGDGDLLIEGSGDGGTNAVSKDQFNSTVGALRVALEGKQDIGATDSAIWTPKVIAGANLAGGTQTCASQVRNYINFDGANIHSSDPAWVSLQKQGLQSRFHIDVPAGKRIWWRFTMNVLVDQSSGTDNGQIIGIEHINKATGLTDFNIQMTLAFSPVNNYATILNGSVVGIANASTILVPWFYSINAARLATSASQGFGTCVSLELITMADL
jgi:hypothetical protein